MMPTRPNHLAATLLFAVPIALLALAPQLAAQQDIDTAIKDLLAQAERQPVAGVWQIAHRLGDLKADEERLAKSLHDHAASLGPKARLAAGSALQHLAEGEEFGKEIADLLRPLAEQTKDVDVATAAIGLLARARFFSSRVAPEIRKLLVDHVGSDLTHAGIRIAAARALWNVGSSAEKGNAKTLLLEFLRSKDQPRRIAGALALAEINTDLSGPVGGALREIAEEPTEQGRLARSFLTIEEQRRKFDADLGNMLQRSTGEPSGDELRLLREIMARVRAAHPRGDKVSENYLLDSAAKGLLGALDRHSAFLTSEEYGKFYFDLNRDYGGIGAFVNFDKDDVFSIVRPIYSGPAYRKNLRSGDKILEVDGWETAGRTSDEIISKLKGKPGTSVTVKVFRRGWTEAKEIAIEREQISVPSVNHDLLPGDVGFLEVVTFGRDTATELARSIADLNRRGAKSLVLDLRNNTGGYLTTAAEVAELFLAGKKLVVYTKGRIVKKEEYWTRDKAIAADLPLAVLINEFSASASEITAGALKDHGRAIIVGTRSFGKGSVQRLMPLQGAPAEDFEDTNRNRMRDEWEPYVDRNKNGKYDYGPQMKLTVAHYYLPSGRCVHKQVDEDGKIIDPHWGVEPDHVVELQKTEATEAWKNAEIFELLKDDVFRKYVRQHMATNKELFLDLANGDGGKTERYPGFDEFFSSLKMHLDKDDVRRWLRYTIRDEVADLRGKAFPGQRMLGDHQEDAQLQEAVRRVLLKVGKDIRDVASYKNVLKIDFDSKDSDTKAGDKNKKKG